MQLTLYTLTDRILLLHVKEGHVVHHQKGQPRSAEKVVIDPLDVAAAMRPDSYTLTGPKETQIVLVRVGRKSKGTEFAWFVDKWENNRAVNTRPDHTKEHWVYLTLAAPLKPGATYQLRFQDKLLSLTYNLAKSRSEAVHVNTLGYVPDAPQKFGYLYHWLGDQGGLDIRPFVGQAFHVIDTSTGKRAFSGKVAFRMAKSQQETAQRTDTPGGNFLGADVAECDFSRFSTPGTYVLSVEGVGCSWPFKIDPDVYRPAFLATARALYHNRSGIALKKPYTEFERPVPHHPKLTPGFAGKLRYTRVRFSEWGSEGGDAKKLMAESPGALGDTWGWYQDAGDWDSYETHLRVAQELLLVYSMAPQKFRDGDLNLPESGNGIPDLLDEAVWLPRFCHRLRRELLAKKWGTGGVGLRVAGDAFGSDEGTLPNGQKVGRGSWEDTDRVWMVSGEDPWSTYRYAGVAANLARFIRKDPLGVDWRSEALECYAWASRNTRLGDEDSHLKEVRAYAAASLFALTGARAYEAQLESDTQTVTPTTLLWEQACYAPAVYALHGKGNPALRTRLQAALVFTADEQLIRTPAKRALRWGGNFGMPMLIGQQTTPWILEGVIGYTLTKKPTYLAALYTTCDYFLGTNALNQTWITGVGPRYPTEIFHIDAWYNGKGRYHPGLIPYSPWRKQKDFGQGPWDADWPNSTVYPPLDAWPGNERWFSNRCSPLASEFTIHQNIGPAAAIFGFLCADRGVRRP
jgi:endoglucanase